MMARVSKMMAVLFVVLLALMPSALAQSAPLEVRIREVAFNANGTTEVTVSLTGSITGTLSSQNVTVTESGSTFTSVQVKELFGSGQEPVAVAVVMDTSGSTAGAALAAAKTAATSFVTGLPAQVRVAILTAGGAARVATPFTTDRTVLGNAINGLVAGQRTSLYDATVLASTELNKQVGAQHNLVVFSDGDDTISTATLADVRTAVKDARAPAVSVLLQTSKVDETAMRAIAAAQPGGRFLNVTDVNGLQAAFATVSQSIRQQYVLTYANAAQEPKDLDIAVSVVLGGTAARDQSSVINERATIAAARPADQAGPLVSVFGSATGLYVGILAAFAAILFFIGMLVYRPAGRRAEQLLARGLKLYTKGTGKKKKQQLEGGAIAQTAMGRRAIELVDKVPRSKKFEDQMQAQLEQAGWPLRSTEFVLIQVGATALGAIFGFVLFSRWWLGIVLMIVGALAPRMVLANKCTKRTAAFLEQLPDTLGLLAGSLQAGYGFMQALDTVSKEAAPPTSNEFSRVLAEARLGMPLEDALDNMAERVGGEDFKWVVLAINIQRQVGGNLATLLSTVADTLREREQVRRQIKVLSAEGRLSAVILVALPFVLVGYLELVNPKYLSALTGETIGQIAIAGALVLIAIGVFWMRKIIRIDV